CRSHLAAELALVQPRVLVCLGAIPWRELAGKDVRFDPRRARAHALGTSLLYPIYHPGYVVRGAYSERAYARDFARLKHLFRNLDPSHEGIRTYERALRDTLSRALSN